MSRLGFITSLVLLVSLAASPASAAAVEPTFDDELGLVETVVPSFGGAYVDEPGGTLNIWTTAAAPGVAEAAQLALVGILGKGSGLGALAPVARPATYRFSQLKAWHDRLSPRALALEGAVVTDLDDRHNRVLVGVENVDRDGPAVRTLATSLDIPQAALRVEQQGPVRRAGLQEFHRPLVGGLQIERADGPPTTYICSLGFVVASPPGFITNSHCTIVQGGTENTMFGQPSFATATGFESKDPYYFTGGACPAGRACRHSDSARFDICCASSHSVGRIANPTNSYPYTNWNGTDTYRIVEEEALLVGQSLRKVGRTTGETTGDVSAVCVNTNVSPGSFTLLCDNRATYHSTFGDSGAPVFKKIGSTTDVSLIGLNWGINQQSGEAFYSPIGNSGVQRASELGKLTNCASAFDC